MPRLASSYWKLVSALLVLLALFAIASTNAQAQTCASNCLRVYSIDLTDLGSSIGGVVKFIDENGSATSSRSSVAHVLWTRPDGSTFDQYALIGTRLRAEFSLSTAGVPGVYSLTVVDVVKIGYTFDPDNSSITSRSIAIGSAANAPPTAVSNADTVSGDAPLTVNFDSYGSVDPDGAIVTYAWDFGDGSGSTTASPTHTYNGVGSYVATLTVTDNMGASDSNSTAITVVDNAAGCSSNCMSVDRMALSYTRYNNRISGQVWLVDENGLAVDGAVVHAVWTLPDGTTVDKYSKIGRRLRADFALTPTVAGHYTLSVVEVIKTDHTFSPDTSNVLTDGIDILI
ncbi:MAG: PKD domain-containing protein [Pseudomonadota bacterium]